MPLYEYECTACGRRFEVLQRMGESADHVTCPSCGASKPDRVLSTFSSASAGGAGGGCGPSAPT